MFRNKIAKFWLAVSVFAGAAVLSSPSQALPSFARQTNKACTACHFENFPMLNDYGRAFKASGFTEIYNEPTRENTDGADLSIPLTLNAAFFGTMRYDRYSGSDMTDQNGNSAASFGEWTVPEEASLFMSGRVGRFVGFHSEVGLRPSAGLAAFKMPFSFPINDTMRVLAIPFASDGHGPSYGFEVLNTGAQDIHQTFENAQLAAAQTYLGMTTGGTGASLVLWDPRFYLNYTKWAPTSGPAGIGSNYAPQSGITSGKTPSSNYFRAVYFVPTPGWDTGIGYQYVGGTAANPFDATAQNCTAVVNGVTVVVPATSCTGATYDGTRVDTKMWAVDAQVQGAVGEHQLGVYFTHASAPVGSNGNSNIYNAGGSEAKQATTIAASYGLIPGKLNVSAAYLWAKNGNPLDSNGASLSPNGTSDNAFTLSAAYMFTQNVKFLFEASSLQNPTSPTQLLSGINDTNGNSIANVKQKLTFKIFYDM